MRALGTVALLVVSCVGLGACSAGGRAARSDTLLTPSPSASSGPSSDPSSGASSGPSSGAGDACAEVRLGIDAFNLGDFAGTVDHFVRAVPLAQAQVAAHDTAAAEQLLAAVTYYAHLAPQAYPQAAVSSPEFAKFKQITLGQCVADQPGAGPSPSPSGVPA